jgi:hypothetical protein
VQVDIEDIEFMPHTLPLRILLEPLHCRVTAASCLPERCAHASCTPEGAFEPPELYSWHLLLERESGGGPSCSAPAGAGAGGA